MGDVGPGITRRQLIYSLVATGAAALSPPVFGAFSKDTRSRAEKSLEEAHKKLTGVQRRHLMLSAFSAFFYAPNEPNKKRLLELMTADLKEKDEKGVFLYKDFWDDMTYYQRNQKFPKLFLDLLKPMDKDNFFTPRPTKEWPVEMMRPIFIELRKPEPSPDSLEHPPPQEAFYMISEFMARTVVLKRLLSKEERKELSIKINKRFGIPKKTDVISALLDANSWEHAMAITGISDKKTQEMLRSYLVNESILDANGFERRKKLLSLVYTPESQQVSQPFTGSQSALDSVWSLLKDYWWQILIVLVVMLRFLLEPKKITSEVLNAMSSKERTRFHEQMAEIVNCYEANLRKVKLNEDDLAQMPRRERKNYEHRLRLIEYQRDDALRVLFGLPSISVTQWEDEKESSNRSSHDGLGGGHG